MNRRLGMWLAIGGLALAAGLPGAALADDNPDFYATIVAVAGDHSTISLAPTKDQLVVVDVRPLGSTPWNQGDFALDRIVLIRTQRIDGNLVATGWEGARTGSFDTAFEGVEQNNRERDRDKDDDKHHDKK
jgi:hypothetical protein